MDDIVKAAMKKWPNVPNAYGWLALDARGDWYLRDEATQAAAPFPLLKGSLIEHAQLKAFIHRNYAADARGAWFFQNGPQRVYVQLELAPWVLGVRRRGAEEGGGFEVQTHAGQDAGAIRLCCLDELGRLYLATDDGLGVVRSMDMVAAADAVSTGEWGSLQEIAFDDLPDRFGFVRHPAP